MSPRPFGRPLGKARLADPGPIYCGRCGRPRPESEHPCPDCRCPEFSLHENSLSEGWRRRQAASGVSPLAAAASPRQRELFGEED